MVGPQGAPPPMPAPLDPAEFDAPPPADPGADYRLLPDAMRKAGADGIAQQSAALVQRIEQDARQRLEWDNGWERRSMISSAWRGSSSGSVPGYGGTGCRTGSRPLCSGWA